MAQLFFEDVKVDSQIPSTRNQIELLHLLRYAAATWNLFRLHIDREFAQEQGFEEANIPASLYGAYLARMITDWIGDPGGLNRLGYRMTEMGFPGDTVICKGKVVRTYREAGRSLVDCDLWAENQEGTVVARASATVSLPSKTV